MATSGIRDPADLFFGACRRKVLGLLLLHPGESFHLREIARATETQPGTVRRELSLLTQAGVLHRTPVGHQVHFQANQGYALYGELRSILKKTCGVAGELRGALASVADQIAIAFVYGSVASGKERPHSDIDLLIVGAAAFEEVIRLLIPCEEALRREINPHVISVAEFKRKARESGSFVARILNSPKVFVLGGPEELEPLARDPSTIKAYTSSRPSIAADATGGP